MVFIRCLSLPLTARAESTQKVGPSTLTSSRGSTPSRNIGSNSNLSSTLTHDHYILSPPYSAVIGSGYSSADSGNEPSTDGFQPYLYQSFDANDVCHNASWQRTADEETAAGERIFYSKCCMIFQCF
ncbi:hypothetical protein DL96DRAFT_586524 [Flagelloscypha sp. PMI_526]|nr:hypothetical protein DL96DRAFT_586524 [Flagelloscypha sp. PMI_526]